MIKNLTERAVFLTFMTDCAPSVSRNSVNMGTITNKWREQGTQFFFMKFLFSSSKTTAKETE